MLDERYPLVRRIVHGLQFCDLLAQCRLRKIESGDLAELLRIFEDSATEGVGELFKSRPCPGRTAQLLFRRTALDYLRLHPKTVVQRSWPARWRWIRTSAAMVRGRGAFPQLGPWFPRTTFEALESRLGHLDRDLLRPLAAYFEVSAATRQYAILGRRGGSVVESFRALALSHAVALWLLRLYAGNRTPEIQQMIDVVAALDRGQDLRSLSGSGHRRRVARVDRLGELSRLVAWYAR
jgi:hypothetical protein